MFLPSQTRKVFDKFWLHFVRFIFWTQLDLTARNRKRPLANASQTKINKSKKMLKNMQKHKRAERPPHPHSQLRNHAAAIPYGDLKIEDPPLYYWSAHEIYLT